jgi:minor extracellular serine protease Vpr
MITPRWFSPNRFSSALRIATASSLVVAAAAICSFALNAGNGGGGSAPSGSTDNFNQGPSVDTSSAIVVLKGDPLSTYSATKPAQGKKIDFNSNTVKSYRAQLSAERNNFKQWLHTYAPKANITSQYDISLNAVAVQLNGTSLDTIAGAPMVERADYNALYHPDLSQSHFIINADPAWAAAGGRAGAGAGIKIGDIDTGIDNNHPFFDPTGFSYPAGFPKCDAADSTTHTPNTNCKYVSPKVIVAKVFVSGKTTAGGTGGTFDAQAIQDHGSHTAGIAAGIFNPTLNAVVNGVMINDMSGIAPGAWLGNYNVFPGNVLNARSEDILNAVETAVADGMDVLNLSLGGGCPITRNGLITPCAKIDELVAGLNNVTAAGIVVAVAAGNSGPGAGTIESPGRAAGVITAGASTNQHFVGEPFTYPSGGGTTVGAAVGDFAPLPAGSFNLFDTHANGCASVDPGASGNVAIIDRGVCSFSQKVANAKAAGAIGVLIINNVAGDPIAMARTQGFDDNIPAVMIGLNEGGALRAANPPDASTTAIFQEFVTANKDILAGFSSQGPTSPDLLIKPDATSVGVNVLSSITCVGKGAGCPGDGSGWAFFSGTSMATPHFAGSAAVLLQLHPGWSPDQVKSALVNTSDRVIKDAKTGTMDVGPMAQGAGRENLGEAADATIFFEPDSASFGKVSFFTLTLSNATGAGQKFSLAALKFTPSTSASLVPFDAGTTTSGDTRISFPASVTVPANGSTTLTVSVKSGLARGTVVQGWITLTGPSGPYHFAYYAVVGP